MHHLTKRLVIYPSWNDGLNVLKESKCKRDHLLMRLCLYQAFREGELLGSDSPKHGTLKGLFKNQVDLDRKVITVYGKGGTVEPVFLDEETALELSEYMNKVKHKNGSLFDLSCNHFRRLVKEAAVKANVEGSKRFSPHTLRAISITHMVGAKGLARARYHARHRSIRTTAIYDRPSLDERRADFNEVFK